ncbi:hypothetical protein [Cellulomonas sp. ATA003]|uniref:hypothetical protein n=1 Tax=Cellulomonas sp. ATA003 TaxID=3073064 RepID=UPI002873661A|nr:hypothetical protein [Cellulomonas sp. ATA003]WNB87664.1 hypothetical protein REH70_03955 [Cellulomonas sp. ATA003]
MHRERELHDTGEQERDESGHEREVDDGGAALAVLDAVTGRSAGGPVDPTGERVSRSHP